MKTSHYRFPVRLSEEQRRFLETMMHTIPKHASWLNIAEIELSVLARQGLAHNIATMEDLCQQAQQWQDQRNQRIGTVNWQFRTADAHIKLKRLYPVQQPDSQPPGHVV